MKYLSPILLLIIIASCKSKETPPAEMFYSYAPNEIGSWIEYEVEEVFHSSLGKDTIHYFLIEKITNDFIDNEGRLTLKIERSWKDSLQGTYITKDIWFGNKTKTTYEKVEENQRFTKLIFPISTSQKWDGNAFNNLTNWEYTYTDLHVEKTINNLLFDSTITVKQIDNINPFQHQVASEIFANNIGMVHKEYINIDNGEGNEIRMKVIAYGQ